MVKKRVWIQLFPHALINVQNNTWSLKGVSVCSTQYHGQDLLLVWNEIRISKVLYRTEITALKLAISIFFQLIKQKDYNSSQMPQISEKISQ